MTAKKRHPIAKLINLITLILAVVGLSVSTAQYLAANWCQKAHGMKVTENSDWRLKACYKHYWSKDE